MAMVVREDGPPDDDTWEPRPIKKNAKGRKKGSDAALIRKFELGEKKRLSIKFDLHELRTAKPIGPNRRHFTGLIGNEIERSVPFCYESWDLVPDKHKGTIWPAINVTYFDMKEHLSGPNAKQVEKGMELQFKGQYRNRKNKFKDEMFVSRGGYENPVKMRNFPPPGKSLSEWHELCDHFTSEKHLAHSAKNKANRAKLPQCSTQGSKSYAASRHEEWETNGVFPDLIELYKKTHQKEGKWAKDVFEARYIKMLKLRASQEGLEEKMTDDEIMDKVLGSSRAFKPGRGRNLPKSTSSSSVCNYPSPEPLVSKSALRRFVEAHNQQMKDWHAQLADKNIELRLPAPLDPNALLEDDAEPRDAADVLEDAANVLEDAAEPGEEFKFKADGDIERYTVRLVAKGFNQKEGVDYKETFAPVAKMVFIRALLAVAINKNWFIEQLDINNAFLHGDLHEEVYMTIRQGYSTTVPPNTVCRLKKSLYGLKQANKQWFTKLTDFLLLMGFLQSYADTSLFTLTKGNSFIALLIYMDDILLTGSDKTMIQSIKHQLDMQFNIKDLGSLHYYLGIEILHNSKGLVMSQRKYALDLLQCANVLNHKPSTIPLDPLKNLNLTDGDILPDPSLYGKLVGKLIYLTITRRDLSFAAQALTCPITRRPVSGSTILLGPCLISWSSKKQLVVSRSSTKAKYRALADCTCEITWLQCLFKDLQVHTPTHMHIFCDNESTIALASNPAADVLTKGLPKALHYNCLSKFGICDPYTLPTCVGVGVGVKKAMKIKLQQLITFIALPNSQEVQSHLSSNFFIRFNHHHGRHGRRHVTPFRQRRKLTSAITSDSDLDFAFHLQMQEAITASLTSSSTTIPLFPLIDSPSGIAHLLAAEIDNFNHEYNDRELVKNEMSKMHENVNMLMHDQVFVTQVMDV
ncbi:retrovirus-related pol polyprotein from transposon TNT 1-94 [Tanacetum coccineum]